MRFVVVCLVVLFSTPFTYAQNTASASTYIDDNLIIYMHSGPGRNYRILGSIEAGVPVSVIQANAEQGFTEITDPQNRQGWVETEYLINTPSRRVQLPLLEEQSANDKQQLNQLQQQNKNIRQELLTAQDASDQLQKQLQQARRTIAKLEQQNSTQDTEARYKMFSYGGIVAISGVILGIIVTFLPKRKRRNDNWM